MDEHLCRGKIPNSGEWIVGYYLQKDKTPLDRETHYIAVDTGFGFAWNIVGRNTVGRCTGLTDKNGAKIFEGDIVQVPFWRSTQSGLTMKGVVEFRKAAFSILWEYRDYGRDFAGYIRDMEVIGNIHDNPELLREES